MTEAALQFRDDDRIGRVASVDTSRVAIDVTNSTFLTRIGIGQLVAIRGATEREYLIAMTERVTRSVREDLPDAEEGESDAPMLAVVPTDLIQGVLVGTFRTVEGSAVNTFKRGADSFAQIDRACFVVEGANLQRFMGMREAIEQLCEEREDEREQDHRDRDDLKAKHERLRGETRRELGIPDPKQREQEHTPAKQEPEKGERQSQQAQEHEAAEQDIGTDRYGNEIIDVTGPVKPEQSRDEPPPLESDSYVPDERAAPPEHDFDFEMGD